jgi:hypothetical protein
MHACMTLPSPPLSRSSLLGPTKTRAKSVTTSILAELGPSIPGFYPFTMIATRYFISNNNKPPDALLLPLLLLLLLLSQKMDNINSML